MANYDFDQNKGKIKRLYPDPNQLYFTFGGSKKVTAMNPSDGYYFIPRTHTNYNVLVDLVYLCAQNSDDTKNDWILQARTQPNLVGGHAEVVYLVVDFNPK